MTQADLDTLARLLTEITPGPRLVRPREFDDWGFIRNGYSPEWNAGPPEIAANVEFIAFMRNHAADLLASARVELAQQEAPHITVYTDSNSTVAEIHRKDFRLEHASQLCRDLASGTNGNVPIQSVFEAMLRLIDREDVIDSIQRDWQELRSRHDD